jgi:hypothetical protein
MANYTRNTSTYGFKNTSDLLQKRIKSASQSRGFAETRLLTHWSEIVGADTAAIAKPVKVGYGRGGLGATLTVLTTGSQAPMLQLQLPKIRDKVNACYGYNAISKIVVTQTAPTGFSEGQVDFQTKPKAAKGPSEHAVGQARQASQSVQDEGLRRALESLGSNVISRTTQNRK